MPVGNCIKLGTTHIHICSLAQEAALLVCQGEDNAKFYHHPTGKWSKKAYKFLHHKFYHVFNLIVCVLLMLLVLGENPGLADDADLTVEAKIAITVVRTRYFDKLVNLV